MPFPRVCRRIYGKAFEEYTAVRIRLNTESDTPMYMRFAKRLLLLTLICALAAGCSWVSRDIYYSPDPTPSGWTAVFTPGRSATKQMGEPDKMVITYVNDRLELSIHAEYQRVLTMGPFWFPIIPMFGLGQNDRNIFLFLYATVIKKDSQLEVDPSRWALYVNSQSSVKLPDSVEKKEFIRNDYYIIKYDAKVSSIERLKIHFDGLSSQGTEIHVPELELVKKKGSLRYEEFTL
jgi:hypothetical protein